MARIRTGIGLCAFFLFAGCSNDTTPPGLVLRLSALGTQRRDRVVVRATVTNESTHSAAWDREFSAHMQWKMVNAQGQRLAWEKLGILPRPPASEFKNRFAILQPGESLVRDFELTDRVRACIEGHETSGSHGTTGGPVYLHQGIFYESVGRFRVPVSEHQITVSLARVVDDMAYGGFSEWFGHDEDELLGSRPEIVSHDLTISFP